MSAGKIGKLFGLILALGLLCIGYGFLIEARWVRVKTITIPKLGSTRFVFIADIHYKGDKSYLTKVVSRINSLKPDFVLFGGDLVEHAEYLTEALELLQKIEAPLYAILGNHELWGRVDQTVLNEGFRQTGGKPAAAGKLLVNESVVIGGIALVGLDNYSSGNPDADRALAGTEKLPRVIAIHEPAGTELFDDCTFALALSGHSHAGQIRLPFIGALIVPGHVGGYDWGYYDLPGGPLYVTSGIGTWMMNARFLARPEIVVVTGMNTGYRLSGRPQLSPVEFGQQYFPECPHIGTAIAELVTEASSYDLTGMHPDDTLETELLIGTLYDMELVELMQSIENRFKIKLPPDNEWRHETIRDLVKIVKVSIIGKSS